MQNEGNYNDNPNVVGFALPPALDGWVVLDEIFLKFICWRITKKIVKVKNKIKVGFALPNVKIHYKTTISKSVVLALYRVEKQIPIKNMIHNKDSITIH